VRRFAKPLSRKARVSSNLTSSARLCIILAKYKISFEILRGEMMERKSLSASGKLESGIHFDEVGGQDGNARVLKTRERKL
jgi:hypothetical protein